ncbi:MAG: hypothetical protein E7456_00980 [Ruminococcaceae bacterium]|nr:hypothetical protein [Oscillospiraceae bacterium]
MRKLIKETPFDLPVENRGLFEFSNYSISVTELVKRINNLIDRETMSPLKLASVTSWLVNTGMLRVEQKSDNSTVKRPTEHGVAIGISVEERVGVRGNYTAVIYNKNAQRFILDNLDAIIEINNKK